MKSLSLIVLFLFSVCLNVNANANDNGIFMVVKGTVKVLSGKDKKESSAKVGTKVFSGDTVITANDSRAKIVMADRNVLQLSPNSRFEITKYKTGATPEQREAQVALMQGKVRVQVEQTYSDKSKFELRTPTAVAGVRGTQYVAQFEPKTQTTTILVLSGRVAVTSPRLNSAPVILSPNMGSTIKEDTTIIEPVRMNAEDIKNLTADSAGNSANNKDSKSSDLDQGAPNNNKESQDSKNTTDSTGTQTPAASAGAGNDKSLVTKDVVGGEAVAKDTKLQSTIQQKPPSSSSAPQTTVPTVNVPKPPATNPLVNEVIQNKNSKTKVIVKPRPQP